MFQGGSGTEDEHEPEALINAPLQLVLEITGLEAS
jgi:hypothetical protein